jgi:hypothetical protein
MWQPWFPWSTETDPQVEGFRTCTPRLLGVRAAPGRTTGMPGFTGTAARAAAASALRWKWVVAVTVARSDLPVLSMDEQLRTFGAGGCAAGRDRVDLRVMQGTGAGGTFTLYGPAVFTRNDVNRRRGLDHLDLLHSGFRLRRAAAEDDGTYGL